MRLPTAHHACTDIVRGTVSYQSGAQPVVHVHVCALCKLPLQLKAMQATLRFASAL